MIRLEGLSKSFPDKDLFHNVNLTIKRRMRAGLVGPNGVGKTTLLRIMLGQESPDEGSVQKEKGVTIGYLAQDIIAGSDRSILEEVLAGYPEIRQLEGLIISLSTRIADHPGDERLLNQLGDAQERFEAIGGWSLEDRAKKILGGLGFQDNQFKDSLEVFSGGWRMRVALATILLVEPDILFLDEPTNHLDLEATLWLESFLAEWKGGLIMISHDRAFLDRAVNNIVEIERKKITLYQGNYSAYREAKVLRQEQHRAAYLNQQKQIAEIEKFIERFRYKSTKARQVQSRIKMLEKLDRIEAPDDSVSSMRVKIPQPDRPPLKIASLRNVSKQYGDLSVFRDLDLVVERDQKIGLVGYNGAGKSTLLKMLAGVEPVSGGTVIISAKVKVAYFAQHQLETLDPDKTVYETIQSISPGWKITGIRAYLGSFMFSGEAVEKKVQVLSGGEKSRLALARMLVEPAHLLLLDEPTNHLDMISRNVVETAMKFFTGSIVCISHDRHFLNSVTNLTCEVGGGNIRMFNGNYDYYTWKKSVEERIEEAEQETRVGTSKKIGYREQKRMKNRLSRIRNRLNSIDKSLVQARVEVNNPNHASDYERIQKALKSMTEMENEYLELMEEQESVEGQLGPLPS